MFNRLTSPEPRRAPQYTMEVIFVSPAFTHIGGWNAIDPL